ncbi:MAG: ABC transporter ATP-binding protein [Desulfobacterota bacterium]|nr:ABC transporter ATP-binding protein [Thermodesulfobacteriota bacterium]
MAESFLEVREVYSGYGRIEVLHGVSLSVASKEIVCIIGPNGSGKSTLLKTIFGLIQPTRGSIQFCGSEISRKGPEEKVKLGMAYIPQGKNIFPSLTVMENLEMGGILLKDSFLLRKAVQEIWERYPVLEKRRKIKAGSLSGGEKQVLAMARASLTQPKLILLDEPSIGLAPKVIDEMYHHIYVTNQEGVTLLIVEQNARKALRLAHRAYVLDLGVNRLEDTGEGLLNNEEVKHLYLGR